MAKAPKPKLSSRNWVLAAFLWVTAVLAVGFAYIYPNHMAKNSGSVPQFRQERPQNHSAFSPSPPPRATLPTGGSRLTTIDEGGISNGVIPRHSLAQTQRTTAFTDTSPLRAERQNTNITKQAIRVPTVDDGLIGHWDFEEASPTDNEVEDLTGNHQVGIVRGARRVPNGVKGQALYFDGQGSRVTGSDVRFPNGNAPSSFALWVNYTGKPGVIFSYGMPDARAARGIALLDEATVKFFGWQSDHDCIVGVIGDGSWHHITANYTGSHVELWIDGHLSCSAPKQWSTYTGMRWIMGRNPIESYTADDFYGFLDDVRVYNRALTQIDIQNVMAEAYYDPIPIRSAQ